MTRPWEGRSGPRSARLTFCPRTKRKHDLAPPRSQAKNGLISKMRTQFLCCTPALIVRVAFSNKIYGLETEFLTTKSRSYSPIINGIALKNANGTNGGGNDKCPQSFIKERERQCVKQKAHFIIPRKWPR